MYSGIQNSNLNFPLTFKVTAADDKFCDFCFSVWKKNKACHMSCLILYLKSEKTFENVACCKFLGNTTLKSSEARVTVDRFVQ